MTVFTVHAPADAATERGALEAARLVPERFSWAAFLFGPFWLAAHGLWRALAGWIVAAALVGAAMLRLPIWADVGLVLMMALWLGLEGHALRRAALARRGWRMVDVVAGRAAEEAERVFFARSRETSPPPRGGDTVARAAPVLGLFPEAGGRG